MSKKNDAMLCRASHLISIELKKNQDNRIRSN